MFIIWLIVIGLTIIDLDGITSDPKLGFGENLLTSSMLSSKFVIVYFLNSS